MPGFSIPCSLRRGRPLVSERLCGLRFDGQRCFRNTVRLSDANLRAICEHSDYVSQPSRNLLTNFAGRRLQERLMTLASKGPAMELEDGQEQKLVIAEYMNHVGCASAAGDDFAKSPDREKVPSSPISPALPSFFPSFVLRAKRALPHRADRDGSGQESNYRPPC